MSLHKICSAEERPQIYKFASTPFMPVITEEIWGYLPSRVGNSNDDDFYFNPFSWPIMTEEGCSEV